MHAHGVEILNRTDNDAVIIAVTHHFHLVLFPAEYGFFQQHLGGRRKIQTVFTNINELFLVVSDTATAAAHGKGRPDNNRETDRGLHLKCDFHTVGDLRPRRTQTDVGHGIPEQTTILGHINGFTTGADHLNTKLLQHTLTHQVERTVQCRLPTHGGQQRVRTFFLDDLRHCLPVNRFDINRIRHVRIGHDGGRVGVHQHHPKTFLAQCLAGLGTGIIKLAGLSDDDRAGAYQ